MKTRFYLTGSAICMNVAYNGKRVRLGLGISVNPADFDTEKQTVKKSEPTYAEINRQLKKASVFVNEFYHTYLNSNGNTPPPPDVLVNAFNSGFLNKAARTVAPEPQQNQASIFQFADDFLKTGKLKPQRVRRFKNVLSVLKEFLTANVIKPTFEALTFDILESYKTYLFDKKLYNPNTAGFHVKIVKQILNEATRRKHNKNLDYQTGFTAPANNTDNVYLTEPELQTLLSIDLTGKPYLNNTRNLFLIGCYSGLRFSDFSQLKPENITTVEGTEFINIAQQKTGNKVTIPLHPVVKKLLSANNGKPPRPITNQRLNEYVKELCQIAGINTPVEVTKYKAQMRTKTTRQKWQLVTTHTARRSFATNAYLAGLPIDLISSILGHSNIQQTQTYLKLDAHEKAMQAAKHAFFNPSQMQIAK